MMRKVQINPIVIELICTNIHKIINPDIEDNSGASSLLILDNVAKYIMKNVIDIKLSYVYKDKIILILYGDTPFNQYCGLNHMKLLSKITSMATLKLNRQIESLSFSINNDIIISGDIYPTNIDKIQSILMEHQLSNIKHKVYSRREFLENYIKDINTNMENKYSLRREYNWYVLFHDKFIKDYTMMGIFTYRDFPHDKYKQDDVLFRYIYAEDFMKKYMYRYRIDMYYSHNTIYTDKQYFGLYR